MAGAPLGNQNAAKSKLWSSALLKVSEVYPEKVTLGKNDKMKGIYEAAYKFWDEMMAGNQLHGSLPYFKELGDRVEGKPPQSMDVTSDGDNIMRGLTVKFVSNDKQ
jgi:hypothetical protein